LIFTLMAVLRCTTRTKWGERSSWQCLTFAAQYMFIQLGWRHQWDNGAKRRTTNIAAESFRTHHKFHSEIVHT
jgi:hypothetical protein